ncbi:MAG: flagellin hook IN motif-containing protein, partial [Phycisphaerae bacterium]|nr:flagellin hook IN motif-containing protein [Phycisphaerae bacterium]
MSRINTNVQSLVAQNVLGKQQKSLATSLERLSTGLRINSAKDDPAGLIASENLRTEKAGTAQAITNATRASSMIGTADGSLNEVSSLLVELQTLVTQTASDGGLSDAEINANQQQVDSILSSINRISAGTQFGGKKLLDGTLDYTTSGVTSADIKSARVNSAKLGSTAKTVQVEVTTGATTGAITYASAAGGLTSPTTLQVTGNKGTEVLALASGATIADIQAAVNGVSDSTGVSATTVSSTLTFN